MTKKYTEGETLTTWGNCELEAPLTLVRNDSLAVGDAVWSSHSGPMIVASAIQYGDAGQTTEVRGTLKHQIERYDSGSLMPLIAKSGEYAKAIEWFIRHEIAAGIEIAPDSFSMEEVTITRAAVGSHASGAITGDDFHNGEYTISFTSYSQAVRVLTDALASVDAA